MQPYTQLTVEKNSNLEFTLKQQKMLSSTTIPSIVDLTKSSHSKALQMLQNSYGSTRIAPAAQINQLLIDRIEGSFAFPPLAQHKLTVDNTSALTAQLSMGAVATSVTTCWSSRQMTRLMQWRNPPENAVASRLRTFVNIVKKAVTECCLPFLTVTAAVETIAYKALSVGAKLLSPFTKRAQEYVEKHKFSTLQQSAQFTTLWTVISLWSNIKEHTLPTKEKQASGLFRGLLCP